MVQFLQTDSTTKITRLLIDKILPTGLQVLGELVQMDQLIDWDRGIDNKDSPQPSQ